VPEISLEPLSWEYGLFRDQYDALLADLEGQGFDVHLKIRRPVESRSFPPIPDIEAVWDLIVRVSEVVGEAVAVVNIGNAIRARLRGGRAPIGPHQGEPKRAIIYLPRGEEHVVDIPAADTNDDVVFKLWVAEARLPFGEANEILGRAVDKKLPAQRLTRLIRQAMRSDSPDRRVVDVDAEISRKEIREELLLILEAIEGDHPLTTAQAELREALHVPTAGL
jgi:hypothetical protein